MNEFARPFVAIRKDPRWVRKLLAGAAFMLIPLVGWFAWLGWGLGYRRGVAQGDDEHLPEWKPFQDHLVRGVLAAVGVLLGVLLLAPLTCPLCALSMYLDTLASSADRWELSVASWLAQTLLFTVVANLVWGVVGSHVALHEKMESAFQFKEMWSRFRTHAAGAWRAWWFSLAAYCVVMLPAWMLDAGWTALESPAERSAALGFALGALGILSFVASFAGLLASAIATNHYWGRWARIAYELPVGDAGTPSAPEPEVQAVTGVG